MFLLDRSSTRISGPYGAPRAQAALVERTRLLDLLDGPQALTAVRAPAGFGKTALVAQWVRSRGRPAVWITIDSECETRPAFWRRLGVLFRAAGHGHPGDAIATMSADDDVRGPLTTVAASVSTPIVVVVDGIERIRDGDLLEDLLAFVRHGEWIRLVVVGHDSVGFTEPAVALEFRPQVVDGRALCFTPDETARALQLMGADDVDPNAVHEATAGVPFAVRMLGLEATTADNRGMLTERLDQQVWRTLRHSYGRSAFARFLLRTSPGEDLSAEIAADLAQVTRPAALRLLAQAGADGLGSWTAKPAERNDATFSFVPIVRSALWSRLRRDSPELANELSRRYARWSMTHGDPYSATIAAVRGGDVTLASRAIWRGFFSISADDSARTVEALERVPPRTLKDHPPLALFLATQYGATETGRARARRLYALAAASAARLVQNESVDEAERFALTVVELVATRMIGRTEAAVAAAGRLVTMYRTLSPAARQGLDGLLASRLTLAGNQFWQAGEIARAIDVYTEANLVAADEATEAFTVPLLAAGAAMLGTMPLAQEWIERARRLDWPPEENDDDYLGAPYHLAEAIAALERFDLDDAERHVRAVEQTFISNEYWSWFLPVQAYIDAARGRPHAGLIRLRAARDDAERPPPTAQLRAVHDVVAGLLHVSAGELVKAERAVARPAQASAGALVVKALSALAGGSPEPAAELARAVRSVARAPRFQAIGLLLHAAAAVRLDERKVASVSLERAAALMDLNGLRSPLTFLPPGDLRAVGDVGVLPADWLNGVPRLFPDAAPHYDLTARELRLLTRLATSEATLADLATDLHVSVNTLRAQRASLYRKLGVRCRAEAVDVAEAAGMLTDAS